MMCRTQDPIPKPHQLFHLSFVLHERGSRWLEVVFALHSSEVKGGLLDGKCGKELSCDRYEDEIRQILLGSDDEDAK